MKATLCFPLQTHEWQFTPQESKCYSLRAALQASLSPLGGVAAGPSPSKVKAVLSVLGQGTCGEIQVFISYIGMAWIDVHV